MKNVKKLSKKELHQINDLRTIARKRVLRALDASLASSLLQNRRDCEKQLVAEFSRFTSSDNY